MSDDEDYMSDKFLEGSEKHAPPSLIFRHVDRVKHELTKKKAEIEAKLKEKNRSTKHIEEEKREEGLSSAIGCSNKGFQMLMKMGYKPGQGIGKTESGIAEPVGIELKSDRKGLGKAIKKKSTKSKNTEDKLNSAHVASFRDRIAQRKTEQMLKADLFKSQKVCEQLDTQMGLEKPYETWFWLPKIEETDEQSGSSEEEEEEEEYDSLETNEKLEILTKYLREKHFYCIWCGVAYNDEDDLRDNCPGNTRSDH